MSIQLGWNFRCQAERRLSFHYYVLRHPEPGLGTIVLLVFAVFWVMAGAVMLLWPARVRSLTNPDWKRFQTWPLAATSLIWYRVSGLGFVLVGSIVIYVIVGSPG